MSEMTATARWRATYAFQPVDHLVRREFYIWGEALERWQREGMPPLADPAAGKAGTTLDQLFHYDPPGSTGIGELGWCEPAFVPALAEQVLETGGEYEIVRDGAGRTKRVFKGKRHGFMPTYLKHAVATDRDWDEDIAPLLAPQSPARWHGFAERLRPVQQAAAAGQMVTQHCIGGYMYLRALVGPEDLLYLFVDNPRLVHKMMQRWLELADAVTARVQQHVAADVLFLAEDICYNHGLLISPDMVREFLFPYYQQLLANMRSRQQQPLLFQLDTDGNVNEAVDLYRSIGMQSMLPFEVAAENDLVALARKHPDLVMSGGIDKRILAAGPRAIDAYLERVMPYMVKRGGFIPTCDHGVPDDVSYASYCHYRRRMLELDHQEAP